MSTKICQYCRATIKRELRVCPICKKDPFKSRERQKEEERRSSPEYQAKRASIKEKNKEQLAGLLKGTGQGLMGFGLILRGFVKLFALLAKLGAGKNKVQQACFGLTIVGFIVGTIIGGPAIGGLFILIFVIGFVFWLKSQGEAKAKEWAETSFLDN
jgi:hypothetical protein